MGKKRRFQFNIAYLYIAPAMIGCFVFMIFPLIYTIYLSVHRVDLLVGTFRFVAMENYVRVFNNTHFRNALGNTFIFTVVVLILSISLALLLAVWLNKNRKMHYFVQSAAFIPHIIPMVSVAMLFMWMMNADVGLINYLLSYLGVPRISWLGNPDIALTSIIMVVLWKTVGYNTLILLAGLQSISKDIYESASLDRSSKINTFFKITIPLLSPTLFFLLIINTLASFQVFDAINVMTQGGPIGSTNVLVYWIYQTGFEFFRMGEAATGSIILLIIVAILTVLNFKLMAKRVHYQ